MKPFARVFWTLCWLGALLIGGAVALTMTANRVGQHKASTYGDAYWQFQQSWGGEVRVTPPQFNLKYSWTERVYSTASKSYETKLRSESLPLTPREIDLVGDVIYGEQKRALLTFNAYETKLNESYRVVNTTDHVGKMTLLLSRPENVNYMYDYVVSLPGSGETFRPTIDQPMVLATEVEPGDALTVEVRYSTKGMDVLRYALSTYQDAVVDRLDARLSLNTDGFEVLRLGMPHEIMPMDQGAGVTFNMENFATTQDLGIAFDSKAAYLDQIQSLMQYSPVALVLWMIVLFCLIQINEVTFNPLHYLFLGATHVFYYLFVAYLIRFLGVWATFAAATALTAIMVALYAPNVLGWPFTLHKASPYLALLTVGFSLVFLMPIFRGLLFVSLSFVILMTIMIAISKSDISSWPILRDTTHPDDTEAAAPTS